MDSSACNSMVKSRTISKGFGSPVGSFFSSIYLSQNCWVVLSFCVQAFGELPDSLPQQLHHSVFPQALYKDPNFSNFPSLSELFIQDSPSGYHRGSWDPALIILAWSCGHHRAAFSLPALSTDAQLLALHCIWSVTLHFTLVKGLLSTLTSYCV